jgi:hypothetical protein
MRWFKFGRQSSAQVPNPLDIKPVSDKQSFLRFVAALEADLSGNTDSWENPDLRRFLAAMMAWTKDSKFEPSPNPWRHAASLLVAARGYE